MQVIYYGTLKSIRMMKHEW